MKKNILFRSVLVVFFAISGIAAKSQSAPAHQIKMTDFNVIKDGNKVEINWVAEKNATANYFEVEKSSDGKEFRTVAIVMGPDPLKKDCDCYGCFDKINPKSAIAYYRLKHVDSNGIVKFSEVKMIALK